MKKIKKLIILLIELVFIVLLIFSVYKIYNWYKDNKQNKQILKDISDDIKIEKDEYIVNFEKLKQQNQDTVAWLKVNSTNIEYPVVKTNDNDYYLTHNFQKEYNLGGWVFADYKNNFDGNDKNIVIYGHNMKDSSMFGTLKNTLKPEWQNDESNFSITLITENSTDTYKVFSTYRVKVEEYYIKTSFGTDDEYIKFLSTIKQRSNKYYNETLDNNDQILTLSTCDSNNKYRVVVHAKKIN